MATVSSLNQISVALLVALLGFAVFDTGVAFKKDSIESYLLCASSLPFFLLAHLIAREHILMISHDEYLMNFLRPRILRCVANSDDEEAENSNDWAIESAFMFIPTMSAHKVALWDGDIVLEPNATWPQKYAPAFIYLFPLGAFAFLILLGLWNLENSWSACAAVVISTVFTLNVFKLLSDLDRMKRRVDSKFLSWWEETKKTMKQT